MVQTLLNGLVNITTIAISYVMLLGVWLTQGISYLMGLILDWVIGPNFINLSYTRPCTGISGTVGTSDPVNCNPIIGIGLSITQNFVNLLLVVILVYIALSIALRIGERNAQQFFVKLLIIALLVNFAPVLVGLIVDGSNIIMNYFLTPPGRSKRGYVSSGAAGRFLVARHQASWRVYYHQHGTISNGVCPDIFEHMYCLCFFPFCRNFYCQVHSNLGSGYSRAFGFRRLDSAGNQKALGHVVA